MARFTLSKYFNTSAYSVQAQILLHALVICVAAPFAKSLVIKSTATSLTLENDQKVGNCTFKQYQCEDNSCILYSFLCDGQADCSGGEDEKIDLCTQNAGKCKKEEFQCGNGVCIPNEWVCDNDKDCSDGSDEDHGNCGRHRCGEDEFSCKSMPDECIPLGWKCDGNIDCMDGSDEESCNTTCSTDEFKCDNGNCIPQHTTCNSYNDCGDNSDEKNCTTKPCEDFQCGNGECISTLWRCDGEIDCADGTDELGCFNITENHNNIEGNHINIKENLNIKENHINIEENHINIKENHINITENHINCDFNPVSCALDPKCLQQPFICDGVADCPNAIDEASVVCKNFSCPEGSFQCGDKTCVPKNLVCDGVKNCPDGSDENCNNIATCNTETHIDCGNGKCMTHEEVCERIDECPSLSAEERKKCLKDHCGTTHGCSHTCMNGLNGYYCSCPSGFELSSDRKTCIDVDECKLPETCSQICVNHVGSYSCECLPSFQVDSRNPNRCVSEDPNVILATPNKILNISIHEHSIKPTVSKNIFSKYLDIDYNKNLIFWSDSKLRCIFKQRIGEENSKIQIVSDVEVEGLSVDWIHNLVYWTDKEKGTIEVSDYDGKKRLVLVDHLESPRALAVNPLEGTMFWTEWGNLPKIVKSSMDGTNKKTIISTGIMWPNGITIDFIKRRVMWVDAKLHVLFSSDFDGKTRRVVLSSSTYLKHPFSIDIFGDFVYWSDWDKAALYRANKFNGEEIELLTPLDTIESPMTIKVSHSLRQINMENDCKKCSHMCLPSSGNTVCRCPTEMQLMEDGITCGILEIVRIASTTTVQSSTTTEPSSTTTKAKEEEESIDNGNVLTIVYCVGFGLVVILSIVVLACVKPSCTFTKKLSMRFTNDSTSKELAKHPDDKSVTEPLNTIDSIA